MKNIQLIVLGVLSGLLLFFSPGSFSLILIILLLVSWLYKKDIKDINFIVRLFLSAFALRVVLLAVVSIVSILSGKVLSYPGYPGFTPALIGDSAYYTLRGYWMALDWKGIGLSERVLRSAYNPIYGWHGYTYVIAFFNYLFGFSPISSKLVNCIFSSLSAILAFLIVRESCASRVAKLAGILVAFLPSLVLWSITNMKDSSLVFVTLLILWSFIMFYKRKDKVIYCILIVVGLMVQSTLRKGIFPLTAIALVCTYIAIMPRPKFSIKILIGLSLVIALLLSGKPNLHRFDLFVRKQICAAISIHQAAVLDKGTNYRILDDKYYMINKDYRDRYTPWYAFQKEEDFNYLQYAQTIARGWFYFLLEPFPWKVNTKLQLLAYPQMILWYFLVPFTFFGSLILLRYKWREYLVLFVYFGVVVSGCALTMANIGTAFRFRDMVSPVLLMFAAVGIGKLIGWEIFKKNDRAEA